MWFFQSLRSSGQYGNQILIRGRHSSKRVSRISCVLFGVLVVCSISNPLAPAFAAAPVPDSYAARASFDVIPTATACPPGQMAPLLLAIAPALIKQGFAFLQGLAAQRASEYDATAAATAAEDVLINCGTIAKPNLKLRLGGLKFGYGVVSGTAAGDLLSEYAALGFTKTPNLYMEGKLVGDSRHVRFTPTKFAFNKKIAKRGDAKDLVVTLSFNFPTASSPAKSENSSTQGGVKATTPTGGGTNTNVSDSESTASSNTGAGAGAGTGSSTNNGSIRPRRGATSTAANTTATDRNAAAPAPSTTGVTANNPSATAPNTNPAKTATVEAPASNGSTQSVQLPVFDHISDGSQINMASVTTGWIIIPGESAGVKTDAHDTTLPVTVNIVIKETDQGNGSKLWLEIADAISSSESSIEAAIVGKNQSNAAASNSASAPKK